jgi:hypothetical protein
MCAVAGKRIIAEKIAGMAWNRLHLWLAGVMLSGAVKQRHLREGMTCGGICVKVSYAEASVWWCIIWAIRDRDD